VLLAQHLSVASPHPLPKYQYINNSSSQINICRLPKDTQHILLKSLRTIAIPF